jgi:hypothetical protein
MANVFGTVKDCGTRWTSFQKERTLLPVEKIRMVSDTVRHDCISELPILLLCSIHYWYIFFF